MIQRIPNPSMAANRPDASRVRAVLFVILLLVGGSLAISSCSLVAVTETPATTTPTESQPSGPVIPPITEGDLSRSQSRTGTSLLAAARDSLSAGALEPALAGAETIIQDFPELPGSGEALEIAAQIYLTQGQPEAAASAAHRYAGLLGSEHPYFPRIVFLEISGIREGGNDDGLLEAILRLPPGTSPEYLEPGRVILREIVASLPSRQLGEATEAAPLESPLRGILAAELAANLYQRGETEDAIRWAQAALAGQLDQREEALAQGVLDGRLEEVLGQPLILGTILPRSGVSPSLLQYGEWIYEGVQVALEEYRDRLPRPVQLEVIDDRGSPLGGRTAMRSLEGFGAFGAIGPLTQDVLLEAANTRQGPFPLISPFTTLPRGEATDVYSLSGSDPAGARMVARMAWEIGLESVAVVRPQTEASRIDAEAFLEEFEALGGMVPRDIVFDSGGTFFQPQFQEVEALLPDGLFLPLAPRDIQLLAPQVTFYGLDTLGIQLLGTTGWTEDVVVVEVDSRHTDGVVAATARITQDETESFQRFKTAYEAFFHQTLRSQVPAFGYDAAAVFLQALMLGPRNPQELIDAMEEIRSFPGATGNLSVEGGWITREPLLVRIQDHELIYITRRYR